MWWKLWLFLLKTILHEYIITNKNNLQLWRSAEIQVRRFLWSQLLICLTSHNWMTPLIFSNLQAFCACHLLKFQEMRFFLDSVPSLARVVKWVNCAVNIHCQLRKSFWKRNRKRPVKYYVSYFSRLVYPPAHLQANFSPLPFEALLGPSLLTKFLQKIS